MGILFLIGCSEDSPTSDQTTSTEIAFVLCEGNIASNNASLHGLNDDALSLVTGDTGSSMTVYNNQLLVINNGSSNVVVYNISTEGIVEYEATIDLILPPASSSYKMSYNTGNYYQNFTTHSEFGTYVTNIGLYNDERELLIIAKLSKPIKNDKDLPISFLVRFDS